MRYELTTQVEITSPGQSPDVVSNATMPWISDEVEGFEVGISWIVVLGGVALPLMHNLLVIRMVDLGVRTMHV